MTGNRVFTEDYRILVDLLVEARRSGGVTQRVLAARLGRSPSHIARIERRQRKVETVEFYLIAKALGVQPSTLFEALSERLDGLPPRAGARN